MTLEKYLKSRSERINQSLEQWLPAPKTLPSTLHQSMRYSIFAGGKRLRPILMLASYEIFSDQIEKVLHVGCALEMIHTYSLIHDDLPSMDNDDLRRGRPTNHKIYGESIAILAGDALLTEAFNVLADRQANKYISPELTLQVIALIARYAGSQGMVGGQVVDMESEGKNIDFPTLEYIHTHKTGGMILASVLVGAILGGADGEQLSAMKRFGAAAGLAFQVADDILNVTGSQNTLGKETGSDEKRGKATYPALLGLKEARSRASELCSLATDALIPLGPSARILQELARYMIVRNT
jgi:geranylgeranyl diphosphate synthase type II